MAYIAKNLAVNLARKLSIGGLESSKVSFQEMIYANASERILLATPTGYAAQMGSFAANNPAYCSFGGRKYVQIEKSSVGQSRITATFTPYTAAGTQADAIVTNMFPWGMSGRRIYLTATSGYCHPWHESELPSSPYYSIWALSVFIKFNTVTQVNLQLLNNGTYQANTLFKSDGTTVVTAGSAIMKNMGGGLFWCLVSCVDNASYFTRAYLRCSGSIGNDFYIGAMQIEYNTRPYATSPFKLVDNDNTPITRAADVLYIPAALRSRVYVPHSINVVPRFNDVQLALTSSKNCIEYFDDSGGGYGIYLDPDKKLHIAGAAPIGVSTALTFAANSVLTVKINRAAGTVQISGCTSGDQTITGLSMPATDGNVYQFCNASGLMQFDGIGSEPY